MIFLMTTAPPEKSPWGIANKIAPLGIAYVAAALEKEGFKVELVDNYLLNKPISEIKQMVRRLSPKIVGIGCSSNTYRRCVETAKAVKEVLPSCKVVVGGWHPSCMPESMLKHPEIDYVIMGEGERAMVELANNIFKGKNDSTIAAISGLAYKHEEEIIRNKQTFIEDLDAVPFPARHLLPMHLYDRAIDYLSVKPVDTMSVVRGCPHDCTWCNVKGLWGKKCRSFSPFRVVEEITHLVDNYGSKGIYFVGDNFTINKANTVKICKLMKENKLDIEWACETGVDLISRELLMEMKAAGCRTIFFGVESGSAKILKKINRGITLQQVTDAFKLCKEEGMQTVGSFIIGIPGETIEDMEATYNFAKILDPDWFLLNVFIAYPGCSLYDEILQKGLYDRLEDFLAYVKTDDFNYELLLEIQRRFHRNFNRSPKRILRKIRREGFFHTLRNSHIFG